MKYLKKRALYKIVNDFYADVIGFVPEMPKLYHCDYYFHHGYECLSYRFYPDDDFLEHFGIDVESDVDVYLHVYNCEVMFLELQQFRDACFKRVFRCCLNDLIKQGGCLYAY